MLMDGSFSAEDDEELEEELQRLTAVQTEESLPAVPSHEVEVPVPVPDDEVAEPVQKKVPKRQAVEAD